MTYMNRPKETTYVVWRRGDGYVGSSAFSHREPDPNAYNVKSDRPMESFTQLLISKSWPECHELIRRERDTDEHRALVASWRSRP
jgi:hypothetical protein